MAVVTLSDLMTRVRQRADMVNSLFVSDSELTNYINAGKRELEDMLMNVHGPEFYATSGTFSITNGTENYSLSAITAGTFYQLLGVDQLDTTGSYKTLSQFNFQERNDFGSSANITYPGGTGFKYRVVGDNLMIRPVPGATHTLKLWWVPQQTNMSHSTNDSFQAQNGWEEYIVVRAAIMCKDKEESDTSVLQGELAMLRDRIKSYAPNRDSNEPQRINETARPYSLFPWGVY